MRSQHLPREPHQPGKNGNRECEPIDAVKQSGELERIVREQLEPFYSSPEVAAILGKKS